MSKRKCEVVIQPNRNYIERYFYLKSVSYDGQIKFIDPDIIYTKEEASILIGVPIDNLEFCLEYELLKSFKGSDLIGFVRSRDNEIGTPV